jgi:hypothetical protein
MMRDWTVVEPADILPVKVALGRLCLHVYVYMCIHVYVCMCVCVHCVHTCLCVVTICETI